MSTEFEMTLSELAKYPTQEVGLYVLGGEAGVTFNVDAENKEGAKAWGAIFQLTIKEARDLRDFLNLIVDRDL